MQPTGRNARKTYGIYGLTEITVMIPAGKARIKIHFTGGTLTGYGVNPATYTTANANVQAMIENSPQFRSGRIKRIR